MICTLQGKINLNIMTKTVIFTLFLAGFYCFGQYTSHFYGTIGDFPIEMELINQDGDISGWYQYPGKSTKLSLDGVLTSDNKLRLKESNPNGNMTGLFNGSFDSDYISNGIWQSADLKKEFAFQLKLDNNISLLTGERITLPNNELNGEERRMYLDSKVKGLSKLWLWIVIGLILGIGVLIYYFSKTKKNYRVTKEKLEEKPKVIVKKELEKQIHFVNDTVKSDDELNVDKGKIFEELVVKMFMEKKEYFEWIDKTPDVKVGDEYPKSNMNPDLLIKFKNTKHGWQEDIAIECKYRTGHTNNEVFIDEERKIQNYKNYQRDTKINTYLALGFGGKPEAPKRIFVLSIDDVKSTMQIDDLNSHINKKSYFFYNYNNKTLE